MKSRVEVIRDVVEASLSRLKEELFARLGEKGYGSFISEHETLGVITEEYDELIDAVRADDPAAVRKELMDIAVACVFGDASIHANGNNPS